MLYAIAFMYRSVATAVVAAAVALSFTGCARNGAAPAPQVTQVAVARAVTRPVTDFDEFTGRLAAVERVEIRPRVSGYVASVNFEEGHEVSAGDVLFFIDPRPYVADLKRAKAELAHARTQFALARSDRDRALRLQGTGAISQEIIDSRVARSEQAEADVAAAEAAAEMASLNLTYTQVRAPISGIASRAHITTGNLVTSGETLLTTVVSMDTVYVEFETDERSYLRYLDVAHQANEGSRPLQESVWVGLADEEGYPHRAEMVFMDNELDRQTGTIRARGLLDNKDRSFTPGMFARVKLAGSAPYDAVLVNESAIGTDQNVKYLFVVDADNKVEYRPVTLGPAMHGLRVIRQGVSAEERVVVNGLQHVRAGDEVSTEQVAMGSSQGESLGVVAQNFSLGGAAAGDRLP